MFSRPAWASSSLSASGGPEARTDPFFARTLWAKRTPTEIRFAETSCARVTCGDGSGAGAPGGGALGGGVLGGGVLGAGGVAVDGVGAVGVVGTTAGVSAGAGWSSPSLVREHDAESRRTLAPPSNLHCTMTDPPAFMMGPVGAGQHV
jgi:hypothetical protein